MEERQHARVRCWLQRASRLAGLERRRCGENWQRWNSASPSTRKWFHMTLLRKPGQSPQHSFDCSYRRTPPAEMQERNSSAAASSVQRLMQWKPGRKTLMVTHVNVNLVPVGQRTWPLYTCTSCLCTVVSLKKKKKKQIGHHARPRRASATAPLLMTHLMMRHIPRGVDRPHGAERAAR